MALNKEITLPNGIVLGYHRIVRLIKTVNVQNDLEIASYPTKELRDLEKQAIKDGQPCDVYVHTSYMYLPYSPSMTPKKAYEFLASDGSEYGLPVLGDLKGAEEA